MMDQIGSGAIPPLLLDAIEDALKAYDHRRIMYVLGEPVPFPAAVGLDRPLIVIADVHGHSAALATLLRETMEAHPDASVLFLGDLINRGPDSPGALALAITTCLTLEDDGGMRTGILHPGNHEEMLVNVLAYLDGAGWNAHKPFARNLLDFISENRTWEYPFLKEPHPAEAIEAEIIRRLPGHLDMVLSERGGIVPWLGNCPVASRIGNLVFVHGGIEPRPEAEADPVGWASGHRMLRNVPDIKSGPRWIRKGFTDRTTPFPGYMVVHGHTITRRYADALAEDMIADIDPDSPTLPLDSGSFKTGVITGAIFRDGTVTIAHAVFDPKVAARTVPEFA